MTDLGALERHGELWPDEVAATFDRTLELATVCVEFASVERAPRLPDGKRENDAEHSFSLSIVAQSLAAEYQPDLDLGLIAQMSGVHDLPEVYTKDVRTFDISDEDYAKKEADEDEAVDKLEFRLPGSIFALLKAYRAQATPEARFVRGVDKLMPGLINIIGAGVSTFKEDYQSLDAEVYRAKVGARAAKLTDLLSEFPILLALYRYIEGTVEEVLY